MNVKVNLVGFKTILKNEIKRILRIWPQTIVPPAISISLYFLIFGEILFKDKIINVNNQLIPYRDYLLPGLIATTVIMNSYNNSSSSLFSAKFQKSIDELLISPLSAYVIIMGYIFGGIVRGILNGIVVFMVTKIFVSFNVESYTMLSLTIFFMSFFFATAGIINAIFSTNFNDMTRLPSFFLTPMVYLGGVFFTIEMLPSFWQNIALLNPIFHFINILRYSFFKVNNLNISSCILIILCCVVIYVLSVYFFKTKLQK